MTSRKTTAVYALTEVQPGHWRITGDLVMESAGQLYRDARKRIFQRKGDLVLDLSGIDRFDSAGLALLIEWRREAERMRIAIRFNALPGAARTIARICGIAPLLEETPSTQGGKA